jgi:hypothetical protein
MNKYNRKVTIDGVQYDSKFEYRLLKETKIDPKTYHSTKVQYEVHEVHNYSPDFVVCDSNISYLLEAKGRFNFVQDLQKYKAMKKYFDRLGYYEIVFIFENPKTAIPGAKARKDGTKLSNGEWATKEGFQWITIKEVDKFLKEKGVI